MNKNRVQDLTGCFYIKLGRYSREMALDFDKEAIHHFRVEYKKMRAFFRLANERAVNRKIKIPKKMAEVYALAGVLRDQQLQQVRVNETAKAGLILPGEYSIVLGRQVMETRARLFGLLADNAIAKSEKKNAVSLPRGFKLQSFSSYIQNKCADIREILLPAPVTDKSLHEIRKILKDLFYNLEIYRQERKFPPGTWKEKVARYFSPLLDDMGDYQDKCTAISLIEVYCLEYPDTLERLQLALIREAWTAEKTSMKKHLVKKLTTDPVLATGQLKNIPLILDTGL